MLDLGKIGALGVEHVDRGLLAGIERDDAALALGGFILDHAQRRKPGGRGGADKAGAIAMRAGAGGCLKHAGTQALAAHFHQAKARNAADLDARAVVFQRVLHRLFDFADVRPVFHVDEVDHDKAGHVAQAQLAGDFARGFEVGRYRGRLDAVFLGGTARVDVDRDQRLGGVDDQVAAALQLDHGVVHRGQLVFGAITLEQRHRIGILLHPLGVAGHQQLHEILGGAVSRFAFDHHFLDVAVVDVADRALDQVAVRMDQRRRGRFHRGFADLVPQAGKIVEIALDLGLGALQPGGAHDAAHRLGQRELGDDRLQPLAVAGRIDLAADAAAVAGIGHQHAIAAGQAEIGGQRRALVAAFFLDHLDQQHLAALDHVLDLVAAAQCQTAGAQIVGLLGLAAALTAAAAIAALAVVVAGVLALFVLFTLFVVVKAVFDHAAFDRGDMVLVAIVDFGHAVFVIARAVKADIVAEIVGILVGGAKGSLFLGVAGLFGQQRLAVFLGDLVVIRVDFAEGQKAVAIAAEVDERRLQRRFDPGYLGKVDVALDLLVISRFKVEFFNPVALEHRHPGFFLVARIDKHARGH